MFYQELRHETEQTIRVGVILEVGKIPNVPILGAHLDWFYWRYLIKPDGTVVDIALNHAWADVPSCDGVYFLVLNCSDMDQKGVLTLYINDSSFLFHPIYLQFLVIDKNIYDSKYGEGRAIVSFPFSF